MTFLSRRRRARSLSVHAADAGLAAPSAPSNPRSKSRRSRGQALVEFALIVPVMFLLLLIAIDFGRLFFSYIQINNAAREAASFASRAPTNSAGITNVALQETNAQSQVGESAFVVTTSCKNSAGVTLASCALATGGAAGAGNTITVNVNERFTFLTPLIGGMFSNLHLIADATSTVTDYASSSDGSPPGGCSLPVPSFVVNVTSGMTVFADPTASRPNSGVCNISGFNWSWDSDPNNDTVGTATGDSHTYTIPGTYVITLEVSNQAGRATTTGSITVPVVPTTPPCVAPTANFTFTASGKDRTYRDASTVADPINCPITDWLWTFTDLGGTQSNAQNPATQTYGNNGNHPVTLRVTNAGGSNTITMNS
jgi:Flp pilus assembly protein TadG